jgi:hypothetical protein
MKTAQVIRLSLHAAILSFAWFASSMRADTGIIVYGSKGVDARRTGTGHIALIVTDLCAQGIDQVRTCAPNERQGIVLTRYGDLASDYQKTVFVVPVVDHFAAIDNPDQAPLLSSGEILRNMQIAYWREHLKRYLPALSSDRYRELQYERKRFEAGRAMRQLLVLEFIGRILSTHKNTAPTEPVALLDPATQELIPDGRWREVIGAGQVRDSILITAPATEQQELRLVTYIAQMQFKPFNVMSDNCSDFTKGALSAVFDSRLHFRPRAHDLANVWITSPISVATDFLNFAKKDQMPIQVSFVPMMAGTRRPSSFITSVSRGALVPDPRQGKMAMAIKIYFNVLNPLLGASALAVDKASRFANLPRLVHERSGRLLSELVNGATRESGDAREATKIDPQRERVRTFGTSSCWEEKRKQFATLLAQAQEHGILTRYEKYLTLRQGRPFLLPRYYEHSDPTGAGSLVAGVEQTLWPHRMTKVAFGFRPFGGRSLASGPPSRAGIRTLLASHEEANIKVVFKLLTAVLNYDLSSESAHRRSVQTFDRDWLVFLNSVQQAGLKTETEVGRTVEACSCREFDEEGIRVDSLAHSSTLVHRLTREAREVLWGPIR